MLTALDIKNFKAFSEWQSLTLAPITLIYGPNSSGKSSIIHSIMLLKQSLTRPSTQGGLVSNGEYVDLGDYSSMVNRHDISKEISFRLSYSPQKNKLAQTSAQAHLEAVTYVAMLLIMHTQALKTTVPTKVFLT
ncbi:AAA family ATPase [Pseudomonas amygdali]|nr:AAA family ATPase [Pseudomonas amygdali]